jgi:hypothetical protein
MRRTTQVLVALIGVAVVGIAVAHLVLGGAAVIGGSPLNATAEGEHRFFAAIFLCYGLAFLWCVPGIEAKRRQVNLLAGAFCSAASRDWPRWQSPGRPTPSIRRCSWSSSPCRWCCSTWHPGFRNPPDGKRFSVCDRMHSERLA